MNVDQLIEFIKNKWEFLLGWLEITLRPGSDRN